MVQLVLNTSTILIFFLPPPIPSTNLKDFANALRAVGYQIAAVAASRSQAAATFATQFGIPTSYGSYAELAADTEVDVVYIGTIHPMHKEQTLYVRFSCLSLSSYPLSLLICTTSHKYNHN